MKFLLLIITALSAFKIHSAESVKINPQILPEQSYNITSSSELDIRFVTRGIEMPHSDGQGVHVRMTTNSLSTLNTLGMHPEKGLAFKYSYENIEMNSEYEGIDDLVQIDKIDSLLMDLSPLTGYYQELAPRFYSGNEKVDIFLNTKSMNRVNLFPLLCSPLSEIEDELEVGDTVFIKSKLDIPGNPFGEVLEYRIALKLLQIDNGRAYFDKWYETLPIPGSDVPHNTLQFGVMGSGTCIYDISAGVFLADDSTLRANVELNYSQDMGLEMELQLVNQYSVDIIQ